MNKNLIAGLVAALFASSASAFDPFVVKDIRVEGIQRTEAGTVFSYLPVKVGDTMNGDKATQAVKALYATGFFKDVRLEIEGGVLVVLIDERPAIASVAFVGLKAFEKDQILKGLREVGLAESRIFDRALVDKAEKGRRLFQTLDAYFRQRYARLIQRTLGGIIWSYMAEALEAGDLETGRRLFWMATAHFVRAGRFGMAWHWLVALLRLYAPRL
ncbi:MAG TPA: POTRA domain-containing protein, partial [Rhodocyclaceae bacterium]|nr:POTRA domain-containing protein [Rhodocyclaceae bacterium]